MSHSLIPLTDSRQLLFPEQTLFFAIRGERHDGHRYIGELLRKGVRHFVVETAALTPDIRQQLAACADADVREVESSVKTLQEMAAQNRQHYSIPVVGITGSNGKTIVKEWLAQVLAPDFVIQKSPKSFNSQIGVPLSVWPLNEHHTLGIFEAGISRPFEMQTLQEIIRPTLGIFTNIGPAHDEGFRSRKQKVAEKLRLFTGVETLIYRTDYSDIDQEIRLLLRAVNPNIRLIGWSAEENVGWKKEVGSSVVTVEWEGRSVRIRVPFTDDASLENATHTLLATLALGVTGEGLLSGRFMRLRPVSMRLELKEGIHRNLLIDDTYNNDFAGLTIALNFLIQQDPLRRKVLVLSDLLETGLPSDELYAAIARLLSEKGVDRLIGVGPELVRHRSLFGPEAVVYPTTEALLESGFLNGVTDSVLLIKGARLFSFERIVNRLIQKSHGTVLEINLDALTHNLNFYRRKVGPNTRIMVMVKAFAYGSGSAEVASLLQFHQVDYLAVAYADEGVFLRQNGIRLPIMVMNPSPETFAQLQEYTLEPEIYSQRILDEWIRASQNTDDAPPIHLKLDTGMHRLGFLAAEVPALCQTLSAQPTLRVASLFSHLVGADDAGYNAFSRQQFDVFMSAVRQLENALGYRPLRHILNSAGIVRFPDYRLDMVRLGIGLYGVEASGLETNQLRPVGRLRTVVSQVKHLQAGETVGYSRRGVLDHDARIATIAIGYADGFDRRLGNGQGRVWVNGVLCPTVGNVCMDMTMIDVTAADVREGDEAVIFGPERPLTELAAQVGTIPYEILTGVSERVKRVFWRE